MMSTNKKFLIENVEATDLPNDKQTVLRDIRVKTVSDGETKTIALHHPIKIVSDGEIKSVLPFKIAVVSGDTPITNQPQVSQHPLYQTAIHEAGHAVIAAYHGIKFKDVSIRPHGVAAGRLMPWAFKHTLIEQLQGTYIGRLYSAVTLERKVRFEIYTLYAGYAAQLHTGVDNTEGAAQDFEQIGNYGMAYIDPGPELDRFLNECLEHTKGLVSELWHRIEAVTIQLLQEKKITGRAVFAIVGSDY